MHRPSLCCFLIQTLNRPRFYSNASQCRMDDGEAMDCELDHDDERVDNDDIGDGDDDDDDASVGTEPAQGDGADQDASMSISDEFCCDVCQVIGLFCFFRP
jgi:hypothetical protein